MISIKLLPKVELALCLRNPSWGSWSGCRGAKCAGGRGDRPRVPSAKPKVTILTKHGSYCRPRKELRSKRSGLYAAAVAEEKEHCSQPKACVRGLKIPAPEHNSTPQKEHLISVLPLFPQEIKPDSETPK